MERKIPKSTMSSIRAKLISAVAMLLVAVTMVVSSTYAWFTLSTAPEVSGITTAIGANGALEIRLNATTDAYDNHTPGNIVDLAGGGYGLELINLYPSVLEYVQDNGVNTNNIHPNFLAMPSYGANGRPGVTTSSETLIGKFDAAQNGFVLTTETGVRGLGTSSGMSDRELAYRNALSTATTNANLASSAAATSLNTNGAALGAIVIKKASTATPDFTAAEIESLNTIVVSLDSAVNYLETAYEELIIAIAASGKTYGDPAAQLPDTVYQTIRNNFKNGTTTISGLATSGTITVGEHTITLDTTLVTALASVKAAIDSVARAKAQLDTIAPATEGVRQYKASNTWEEIRPILNELINVDHARLNDIPLSGTLDKETIANSVLGEGINIYLESGAGIYVIIADHCGDYSANVQMENVSVDEYQFDKLSANMYTSSDVSTPYLTATKTAVQALPVPASTETAEKLLTEFYGYIIDLAFKTNAASSNLLLQTEAVDRIYEDNNNEATQGKGSYMEFTKTTNELTFDQVKGLMDCIRIVFFDTDTREVIGEARLDTANATVDGEGKITAYIYMYKKVGQATEATLQNGEGADTAITALAQNVEQEVSVLVYLDGDAIENADVAATDTKSLVGTMNLQFSSSAELKPMEYGDLHTPNKDTTTTTTTTNP